MEVYGHGEGRACRTKLAWRTGTVVDKAAMQLDEWTDTKGGGRTVERRCTRGQVGKAAIGNIEWSLAGLQPKLDRYRRANVLSKVQYEHVDDC